MSNIKKPVNHILCSQSLSEHNYTDYFRSSDYPKTRYAKNEGGPISNLRLRNHPAMQLETLIVSISSRIKK